MDCTVQLIVEHCCSWFDLHSPHQRYLLYDIQILTGVKAYGGKLLPRGFKSDRRWRTGDFIATWRSFLQPIFSAA